jgi:hypothetical protein
MIIYVYMHIAAFLQLDEEYDKDDADFSPAHSDYPLASNGPPGEHMVFKFDEDGDLGMARNLYYDDDTDTFIKCKCGNHLICIVDLTAE